jgi:hypothetical protein
MPQATGFCFRPGCRTPVPKTRPNQYFCSMPCQMDQLRDTLAADRQRDEWRHRCVEWNEGE